MIDLQVLESGVDHFISAAWRQVCRGVSPGLRIGMAIASAPAAASGGVAQHLTL